MSQVAKLVIDHTKVADSLTDYPVYVNLADMNAEFWSTVANGGGDIRVFKSDGTTELAREVVSCDTTAETGELHFKYTGTLSSTVDTEVQIHADGTSADYATTDTYGAENVWGINDKLVAHLNGNSTDSTSNSFDGTDTSITYSTANGKIGQGAGLNGTTSRIVVPRTGIDFDYNESFSFSTFAKTSAGGILVSNLQDDSTLRGYEVELNGSGIHLYFISNWSGGSGPTIDITANATTTNNVYNFITITYNGNGLASGFKFYVNGTEITSTTITRNNLASGTTVSNTDINIGRRPSAVGYYDGNLDEVRIYSSTLSADWITTEYNNQNSPSTFYTVTGTGLDLGLGEFTLTGYDITTALKVGTLELGLGEFILTGYDPDFNFTGWTNLTKNASTWTNVDKVDSDWTNTDKVSSSWTNLNK